MATPSAARVLAPRSVVKVRRLEARFDPAAYFEILRDRMERRRPLVPSGDEDADDPGDDFLPITAYFTAPAAVEGRTFDLEFHEVLSWIRSGRLEPTDLIDVGRGWESIDSNVEVAEVVDARLQHERRARWTVAGLFCVVAAPGILLQLFRLFQPS